MNIINATDFHFFLFQMEASVGESLHFELEYQGADNTDTVMKQLKKLVFTLQDSKSMLTKELYESQKSNYLLTKQLERCQDCNLNILEELSACQLANSILREELKKVHSKLKLYEIEQNCKEKVKPTKRQVTNCCEDVECNSLSRRKKSINNSKVSRPDSGYDTISESEDEDRNK